MPIRAAWMHKRFVFRPNLPRRARVTRFSTGAQLAVRGQHFSSMTNRHRTDMCQGTAARLILVRSVYSCSAIYQQFFVP